MESLPIEVLVEIIKLAAKTHQGLLSPYKFVNRYWRAAVEMIFKQTEPIPKTIGNYIKRGHLRPEMVLWLRSQKYSDSDVCPEFTQLNRLDLLKWAQQNTFRVDKRVYPIAASIGSLEILDWLYGHGNKPRQCTMLRSADSGSIAAIKWFLDRGCKFHTKLYNEAVKRNHIGVVGWLLDQDKAFHMSVMADAAQFGRLEIMKLFMKQGLPYLPVYNQLAAFHGHVNILRYARSIACYPDYSTCNQAAKGGQLEVLDWLFEHYPDLVTSAHSLILEIASTVGQLTVSEWGLTRGCRYLDTRYT